MVLEPDSTGIMYEELVSGQEARARLKVEMEGFRLKKFDLEKGPLCRVKLLRIGEDAYGLLVVIHHIISDGGSIAVLLKDLLLSYQQLSGNNAVTVDPLKSQYKDHSFWMENEIQGSKGQRAKQYWQSRFPFALDPLELTAGRKRLPVRSFQGSAGKFYLESSLYAEVSKFCRKQKTTLFNFFRCIISIILHKMAEQNEITIGVPVSMRDSFELKDQIGLYVNTLPLKEEKGDHDDFLTFLKRAAENLTGAFEFKNYPLDKIIEDVPWTWDAGRNPLFDVMMVFQGVAAESILRDLQWKCPFGIKLLDDYLFGNTSRHIENVAAKFDLCFSFSDETGGRMSLEIEYDKQLFDKERIWNMYDSFLYIISQVLAQPAVSIRDIEITGAKERQRLLSFNNTAEPFGEGITVLDLFRQQVKGSPTL